MRSYVTCLIRRPGAPVRKATDPGAGGPGEDAAVMAAETAAIVQLLPVRGIARQQRRHRRTRRGEKYKAEKNSPAHASEKPGEMGDARRRRWMRVVKCRVQRIGRERARVVAVEPHQGVDQVAGIGLFGGEAVGLVFVA